MRQSGAALQATLLPHPSTIREIKNLENGQFLTLSLYGEGGVRVIDDGGPGGFRVELPFLRDPRSFGPWSRRMGKAKTRNSNAEVKGTNDE